MLHKFLPSSVVYSIGIFVVMVSVYLLVLNINKYVLNQKTNQPVVTYLNVWVDQNDSIHYAYDSTCTPCLTEKMKKQADGVVSFAVKNEWSLPEPDSTIHIKVTINSNAIKYEFPDNR